MADLLIREIQPQDEASARQLILAGLQEKWGELDFTKNRDLDNIASSYQAGLFIVAFSGPDLIGTGALVPEGKTTARIVRMWVDRRIRRQGVGTAILERLVSEAEERGIDRLVLETEPDWNDAVSFYKRHGFRAIGIKRGNLHFDLHLCERYSGSDP